MIGEGRTNVPSPCSSVEHLRVVGQMELRTMYTEKTTSWKQVFLMVGFLAFTSAKSYSQTVVAVETTQSSIRADIGLIDSRTADVVIGLVDSRAVATLVSVTDKPERADVIIASEKIGRRADVTVKICGSRLAKKTVCVRKTRAADKTVCVRENAAGADVVVCVTDPELRQDTSKIVVVCEALGLLD
jgi:hypothetical protein